PPPVIGGRDLPGWQQPNLPLQASSSQHEPHILELAQGISVQQQNDGCNRQFPKRDAAQLCLLVPRIYSAGREPPGQNLLRKPFVQIWPGTFATTNVLPTPPL